MGAIKLVLYQWRTARMFSVMLYFRVRFVHIFDVDGGGSRVRSVTLMSKQSPTMYVHFSFSGIREALTSWRATRECGRNTQDFGYVNCATWCGCMHTTASYTRTNTQLCASLYAVMAPSCQAQADQFNFHSILVVGRFHVIRDFFFSAVARVASFNWLSVQCSMFICRLHPSWIQSFSFHVA